MDQYHLFESGERTNEHQCVHSVESVRRMEADLKKCLMGLATTLFGKGATTCVQVYNIPSKSVCLVSTAISEQAKQEVIGVVSEI